MGGTENSSDLDLGRRPELESDEFSVPPIVVIEKISLLCLKPLNRCGSFWEPDPVVVVVREVVEVTLLVIALLPRGCVLSVGVLDLLAIDLVVMEPALLTVHRW